MRNADGLPLRRFSRTHNRPWTSSPNKARQTARGRKQDRARVAGGQGYEVRYEAKKTRRSKPAVKKAVKEVGNSRKRLERRLAR